jgi:cytochrome bd-type quinol oxidase subunit 2
MAVIKSFKKQMNEVVMKSKSIPVSALLGVLSVLGGAFTYSQIRAGSRPLIILGFIFVAAVVAAGMLWLFISSRNEDDNKVFRTCGIIWLVSLMLTLVFLVFGLATAINAKKISWVVTTAESLLRV